VLLILTSPYDAEARALAAAWSPHQAAVLTCADLSASTGWRYVPGDCGAASFSLGGQTLPVAQIDAVLTRTAGIDPADLADVAVADREYVASEMHAFLVAWLAALGPRVVNRPTPRCLLGPRWAPEVWTTLAARCAIPIRPTHRQVPPIRPGESLQVVHSPQETPLPALRGLSGPGAPEVNPEVSSTTTVTVVGDQAFGATHVRLCEHAVTLARAARTDLLAVTFDSADGAARLVTADPRPPLSEPDVVDAVRRHLLARR